MMFPNILLCSSNIERRRKKKAQLQSTSSWTSDDRQLSELSLSSDSNSSSLRASVKAEKKKRGEAAMSKVSNFSDLIQRVTANCLLHPLSGAGGSGEIGGSRDAVEVYEYETDEHEREVDDDDVDDDESGYGEQVIGDGRVRDREREGSAMASPAEAEGIVWEVFEAVAAMKKAYLRLQEAHSPWDAEKMRAADQAVVAEMRRIGVLRERFRRRSSGGGGGGRARGMAAAGATVREVVAPYEAAVEELRREVKARDSEVESLKEKLKSFAGVGNGGHGKKARSLSRKKVSCIQSQVAVSPSAEIFEATMSKVNDGLKSFTSLLLSLMRSAHWDIAAAVRSIEAASSDPSAAASPTPAAVTAQHAKFAMESYVSRKVFQGFDHETFYMDGSLSSLLNPEQFRRDCFTQYRDMKAMDPAELLGILPSCHFGKFCSKKYLSLVHPKMEESLFGNLDQHRQVLAGAHPRSHFYGEFLELAKAVWLLHLLAFSLEPVPSQFEATRGADFHPEYMESVVKLPAGRLPAGLVVGLPVSPGFKMWTGSIVKARVLLVSSRS